MWSTNNIERPTLEKIGAIMTLEQLHLGANFQAGWRYDWGIDHQLMRCHLSSLPLLEKLAFSRDSYFKGTRNSYEQYYETNEIKLENLADPTWTDEKFEDGNRERMVQEAEAWTEKIPRLEWNHFGQVPMTVMQRLYGGKRVVNPLIEERDDCWTLLRETFGWKGILPS